MKNKQMITDTTELAEALKKEPENIQEIILSGVNSILEEYTEDCCTKEVVKSGNIDIDDKVETHFVLPCLSNASSYKLFGMRYFDFEASVSTHYGKKFYFTVSVACSEHINDVFCTKLSNGLTVIACNWLEPIDVSIKNIQERDGVAWKVKKNEPEIVDL